MSKHLLVVVATGFLAISVAAEERGDGDKKKTQERGGTVTFSDGKSRAFTSIVGLTIPPREKDWKMVANGDLLLQGRENDVVIPWDKISSLSITKGKVHQNVEIITVGGKKEIFLEVSSGVEIEWVDSIARSRLSIHDKLLGAKIQLRESKK